MTKEIFYQGPVNHPVHQVMQCLSHLPCSFVNQLLPLFNCFQHHCFLVSWVEIRLDLPSTPLILVVSPLFL